MAAALLVSLCQGHPFLDGNKRTATVLAFNFLAANGLTLEMEEGALEKLVMRVAEGHLGKEGSRWPLPHTSLFGEHFSPNGV